MAACPRAVTVDVLPGWGGDQCLGAKEMERGGILPYTLGVCLGRPPGARGRRRVEGGGDRGTADLSMWGTHKWGGRMADVGPAAPLLPSRPTQDRQRGTAGPGEGRGAGKGVVIESGRECFPKHGQ